MRGLLRRRHAAHEQGLAQTDVGQRVGSNGVGETSRPARYDALLSGTGVQTEQRDWRGDSKTTVCCRSVPRGSSSVGSASIFRGHPVTCPTQPGRSSQGQRLHLSRANTGYQEH
uniref:Uncharacterized protein n=1 Tax=Cacopsylla melanoneura TaxID=428564 RepID=A0A8D8W2X3_9HEMI